MSRLRPIHRCGMPIVAVTVLLTAAGCLVQAAIPPAPCPIAGLLLTLADLPPADWMQAGPPSPSLAPARAGIEKIGTAFSTQWQGVLTHQIYRFRHKADATVGYEDTTEGWFTASKDETPWLTPDDLATLLVAADQHRLGCSRRGPSKVEVCQYFARYGPYVSELSVTMLAVSHADLRALVAAIDDRMRACLGER